MCREHAWDGEACPYCRIEELKAEVTELKEYNEVTERCLNGSSKATYTAEYFDRYRSQMEEDRDRLFARCKIVFYPTTAQFPYPIEHNMAANKDSRSLIEEALTQTEPLPAHPGCCDICDTGGCCKEESEEA